MTAAHNREPYRLLVTGSRQGRSDVAEALDDYASPEAGRGMPSLLIVGDAPGVDAQALAWAKANDIPYEVHTANWEAYGRSAGPRRNAVMVGRVVRKGFRAVCIAFPAKGSVGTWDCLRQACDAGVEVHICSMPDKELTR